MKLSYPNLSDSDLQDKILAWGWFAFTMRAFSTFCWRIRALERKMKASSMHGFGFTFRKQDSSGFHFFSMLDTSIQIFISQCILEQSWSGSPTPPNALTLPFFAVSGCRDGYPSMTGKGHKCQKPLHHQRWTLLWVHGLEGQRIHITTTSSSLFLAGFFLSLVGTIPTFCCFEPLLQSPKEEKKAHVSCLASFHAIPFLPIQPSKHVLSLLVQLSRQTSTHNHLLLSTFLQSQSHLSLFLRIWQLRLFQPCSHLDIWFWKTANHSAQEPENFPVHHLLAHVHFLERACSWQMKDIFLQLVSITVWECVVQLRCIKIM